jgi:hypothetical protein
MLAAALTVWTCVQCCQDQKRCRLAYTIQKTNLSTTKQIAWRHLLLQCLSLSPPSPRDCLSCSRSPWYDFTVALRR